MEDLLLTLQLGCGVQLDKRQALRLGKFIKDLQADRDKLSGAVDDLRQGILDYQETGFTELLEKALSRSKP